MEEGRCPRPYWKGKQMKRRGNQKGRGCEWTTKTEGKSKTQKRGKMNKQKSLRGIREEKRFLAAPSNRLS